MSLVAARGFVVLALLAASSVAYAQAPAGTPPQGAAPGRPAADAGDAQADDGPAAEAAPKRPAAGYAFSDKSAAGSTRRAARGVKRTAGPAATFPGFEQLGDGASRVFVQLTSAVPVEERRAEGTLTYVLKGAHVRLRNNTNALVTVHFNTPVTRARLVPSGKDVHLVIDLRGATQPTYKMNEGQDKTATLTIDFPHGDFAVDASAEEDRAAPGKNAGAPAKPAEAPAKPGSGPKP